MRSWPLRSQPERSLRRGKFVEPERAKVDSSQILLLVAGRGVKLRRSETSVGRAAKVGSRHQGPRQIRARKRCISQVGISEIGSVQVDI